MKHLKSNDFYVRSGVFTALSIAGSAFGFILYPILARILSTRDFGDFSGIVALINQSVGFLAAFNIVSLYLVKRHKESEALHRAQIVQNALLKLFVVVSVVLVAASPLLSRILNINSVAGFAVFSLLLFIAIPTNVWVGYIQGNKEFVRIGIYNFLSAFVKLVVCVLGAVLYGLNGLLVALVVSSVAGLAVLWILPGRKPPSLLRALRRFHQSEKKQIMELLPQIAASIFVVGTIAYLQNFDLTLAKIILSPEAAGAYSGVGFMSNALYFVMLLIVWLILPEISLSDQKVTKRVMGTAFKLFFVLTALTVSFAFLLRQYITGILLGDAFADLGVTFTFSILYQATLATLALICFSRLILNNRRTAVVLCGGVLLLCLVVPARLATNSTEMIRALWLCVTLCLIGYFMYSKGKQLRV